MHQDITVAVVFLWIASLWPLAYAGTRDLIDTDFLIGSSSGSSRISDIEDVLNVKNTAKDEAIVLMSWVKCPYRFPLQTTFWPIGYEAYMFGFSLVRL